MCDYEYFEGRLTPVNLAQTAEESAEMLCDASELSLQEDDCFDTYVELLLDEYYEQYAVVDDKLYRVEKEDLDHYDNVYSMKTDGDCFTFVLKYYNGVCSFEDAVDKAHAKLLKERKK